MELEYVSLLDQNSKKYLVPDFMIPSNLLLSKALFPIILIFLIVEASPSLIINSIETLFLSNGVTFVVIDALYLPLSKYNLTSSCSVLSKIFLSYGLVLDIPTESSADKISSSSMIALSVNIISEIIGFSFTLIIKSLNLTVTEISSK